jgi:hypothetical protein
VLRSLGRKGQPLRSRTIERSERREREVLSKGVDRVSGPVPPRWSSARGLTRRAMSRGGHFAGPSPPRLSESIPNSDNHRPRPQNVAGRLVFSFRLTISGAVGVSQRRASGEPIDRGGPPGKGGPHVVSQIGRWGFPAPLVLFIIAALTADFPLTVSPNRSEYPSCLTGPPYGRGEAK